MIRFIFLLWPGPTAFVKGMRYRRLLAEGKTALATKTNCIITKGTKERKHEKKYNAPQQDEEQGNGGFEVRAAAQYHPIKFRQYHRNIQISYNLSTDSTDSHG